MNMPETYEVCGEWTQYRDEDFIAQSFISFPFQYASLSKDTRHLWRNLLCALRFVVALEYVVSVHVVAVVDLVLVPSSIAASSSFFCARYAAPPFLAYSSRCLSTIRRGASSIFMKFKDLLIKIKAIDKYCNYRLIVPGIN